MIERIISSVLQWMDGKGVGELKNALYYVLSEYDISEKCTDVQRIDRSWESVLGRFLVRKRVEGRSERTLALYNLHLRRTLQNHFSSFMTSHFLPALSGRDGMKLL